MFVGVFVWSVVVSFYKKGLLKEHGFMRFEREGPIPQIDTISAHFKLKATISWRMLILGVVL